MSNVQNRQNAKALNNLLNSQGSQFRLQKILSKDNYLSKHNHSKPLRTEKSSTLSLVKSDSLITNDNKNFFKTSTSLNKLNNIVNFQKKANDEQHKKVIKHLLTDLSYQKLNKISLEGNRVRTLQGVKPELQNLTDQKLKMKDLQEKIKLKLQERDQEYMLKNGQQLNNLQLKLSNLQASQLFKNFLVQNGFRQPAFLKDIQ
ncbi:unnamed protein product [Paramecium pentaurelia]|uniref:Uncharacterized protein n=1 Tax=Paramecium pentaurelia TaxID=43138 RepID=A0A8S1SL63_9CILI|nr:unnamed protein product [Paramecium pentaurelia]